MKPALLLWSRVLLCASFIALPGAPVLPAETPVGALRGEALKELLKPIPVKEPAEAIRCLQVIDGFSVEFVAHEPLVLDPVAAAIDENGLLYVAEDADYPYRPEEGEQPQGRVRVLRDRDGDGFYEESVLFADGLLWPAGVVPWKGGVFVTAPPDIWFLQDTNGDLKADVKEKVYTGFGTAGSQYILNNLQWGLDHKIYAAVAGNGGVVYRPGAARSDAESKATSGLVSNSTAPAGSVSVARRDFRFDPVTGAFESVAGGKQFGNTFDDWGNRFLCTQDTPVYQVVFPEGYLERHAHPFLPLPENPRRLVAGGERIFRTSPVENWRAVRSSRRLLAQKGAPDASGVSHYVLDGVAGATVYRGGAFPSSFYGNLFCGDAQNNLVHRRSLIPDGVLFRSERLDAGTEFLRSTDNWFRPVNFVNAPDGTLYVLDLAREVLEAVHIPMDVVAHLDLTRGRDRGRIYRVMPKGFQRPAPPQAGRLTTAELVACLEHPHAWWRDTAHRLLYERQDRSAEAGLRQLLLESTQARTRLHALWSLEGLRLLSERDLLTGLADGSAAVREHALRLAELRLGQSHALLSRCLELATDPAPRVRLQLALTLGQLESKDWTPGSTVPAPVQHLAVIAQQDVTDPYIRTAILSSAETCAAAFTAYLLDNPPRRPAADGSALLQELARIVGGQKRDEEIRFLLSTVLAQPQLEVEERVLIGLSEGLRNSGGQLRPIANSLKPPARQRWDELMQSALQTVRMPRAPTAPESTKIALRLLENASGKEPSAAVLALLDRFPPAPIQVLAIQTVARLREPGWEESLLDRWRTLSPEARRELLSTLLGQGARAEKLLAAIESGRLAPGELDASTRATLLRHEDHSIQQRANALWGKFVPGTRAEVIRKYRPALDLKGDAQGGQSVFQRLCRSCHRLQGDGNELGPNLALAASRSPDELLTHILDPNREVDPAYVQYQLETTDGEVLSGLLTADLAASVTLKGVNLEQTIPRSRIKRVASAGLSLMPEGLEQGLSLQDMANLLTFLIEARYDLGTSGRSAARDVAE